MVYLVFLIMKKLINLLKGGIFYGYGYTDNSFDDVTINMFAEEVSEEDYKIAIKSVNEVL